MKSYPIPVIIRNDYPSYAVDGIYGRYRFEKGDEFLEHLVALYPQFDFNTPSSWAEWDSMHEAWTIQRFDTIKLSSEFHTNSADVQMDEVYDWIRIYLDGWKHAAIDGNVAVWLVGFDVKPIIVPTETENVLRPTLVLTLAVAYYPPGEE